MDIIHGRNGRSFVLEIDKDRVQFLDENQKVFALKSAGDAPRAGTFANGKLFVITENSDKVYVFDENGTSLTILVPEVQAMDKFEVARELPGCKAVIGKFSFRDAGNDRFRYLMNLGDLKGSFGQWTVTPGALQSMIMVLSMLPINQAVSMCSIKMELCCEQ